MPLGLSVYQVSRTQEFFGIIPDLSEISNRRFFGFHLLFCPRTTLECKEMLKIYKNVETIFILYSLI